MKKKTIEDYRRELKCPDRFEIVIAESLSLAPDNPRTNFYGELERFLEQIGKRMFLPHRDLDYDCGNARTVEKQIKRIIVSSAEVVLCLSEHYQTHEGPEIALPAHPAPLIVSRAHELEIPVKHFVPKIIPRENRYDLTEYSDMKDALEKAIEFFQDFYRFSEE